MCYFVFVRIKQNKMEDYKELFIENVNHLNEHGIYMEGPYVCYAREIKFNINGYNFQYNLYRLGKLIEEVISFD